MSAFARHLLSLYISLLDDTDASVRLLCHILFGGTGLTHSLDRIEYLSINLPFYRVICARDSIPQIKSNLTSPPNAIRYKHAQLL